MKALTFKEKQDVLEDLFKKYHRAVLQLKCLEERNFYPSIQFDTVKEKKMYYQDKGSQLNDQLVLKEELEKVIATFEFILDCLSMESKINALKQTPAMYLGSCRYKLPTFQDDEDTDVKLFRILD